MLWEKQDNIEYKRDGANGYIKKKVDPEYRSIPAA